MLAKDTSPLVETFHSSADDATMAVSSSEESMDLETGNDCENGLKLEGNIPKPALGMCSVQSTKGLRVLIIFVCMYWISSVRSHEFRIH